jgi:redox-sensitive bicupin YhaK (pirin superfamily)
MIKLDRGWLKAKHHSFSEHGNATRMGWGSLRAWNDEEIAPNTGFPSDPHANMEIVTYVREGAVTHKDSLGNEGRAEADDVQVMSAAAGIRQGVSGKPAHERTNRVFELSGAKSQIARIFSTDIDNLRLTRP